MKGMNEPITRGELIEWMYVIASNLPLPVSPTALSNTSWRLESFNTNAVSGSYILTFDTGDSLSTRFCNQMGGKYTLRNMVFQDVHLFSTLMYCDGEGNPLESAFRLE
jgi:heat shock protein HslJ